MSHNLGMSKELRARISERLTHLMEGDPSVDTLEKLSKRSGVSFGTCRRVKTADETDVQIGNVEAIAQCFGLTLAAFVGEGATLEEVAILNDFRALDEEGRKIFAASLAKAAMMERALENARLTMQPDEDEGALSQSA